MNPLKDFLAELGHRLSCKSPIFFRVIKKIYAVAAIVTGTPELLLKINIMLPEFVSMFANKAVALCSAICWLTSGLTVENCNEEELKFTKNAKNKTKSRN